MQASKILPDTIYAILAPGDRLVRFFVTAVVTKRVKKTGSPHDYVSHIEGTIVMPDRIDGEPHELTLTPQHILGPFEEQQVLRERRDAERRAAAERSDKEKNDAITLRQRLYAATGVAGPEKETQWHQPFRADDSDIRISRDGVKALLEFFEALVDRGWPARD